MRDTREPRPQMELPFVRVEGRARRVLDRFGLAHDGRPRIGRLIAAAVAITWLPLIVLAGIDHLVFDNPAVWQLLGDFLPYGQLLISVPILILAELMVGRRLSWAVAELRQSDVLSEKDTPALDRLVARCARNWHGGGANAMLLLATVVVTVVSVIGARDWLTGGWHEVGDRTTLPARWYLLVSLPVMRLLVLRWVWRLLLWSWLMWRVSKLEILPEPIHPDRAGGLAFLGGAQASFGWLAIALGVQLSCLIADAVYHAGEDLMSFQLRVVGYALGTIIVLMLPLLVFVPKLALAREMALLHLSSKGYHGARRLVAMLGEVPDGAWPANDVSGMADYGAVYETARQMKWVPIEPAHILSTLFAAFLPFVPLVLLVVPIQDIARALVGLLI